MSRFIFNHYDHVSCNRSVLASGVVSTALQCGTGRCLTNDLDLSSPVLVTIQHSNITKVYSFPLVVFIPIS